MSLLMTVLVGLLVGLVGRAVLAGREGMGLVMTPLLGVGGALATSYGGQLLGWYRVGEPLSFVAAVVGAFLLLTLWRNFANR